MKIFNAKADAKALKHELPPLKLIKDGSRCYVYSTALKLNGEGNTEEEAQESLLSNFIDFINRTKLEGTFEIEMERLGWVFEEGRWRYPRTRRKAKWAHL